MDKIIGYVNPNSYTPSAVTVIFQRKNELYARCPSLLVFEITMGALEKLVSHDSFIPETQNRSIKDCEYAFALDKDNIIVSNHNEIVRQLSKKIEENQLIENDRRIIFGYLLNSLPTHERQS